MLLVLLVQTVAELAADPSGPPLLKLCEADSKDIDEIVVCAPREKKRSPYRINVPRGQQKGLGKAEVTLGNGVRASAETESVDVGGFPSKRALIRIKVGF
jgi:hypothetical protein